MRHSLDYYLAPQSPWTYLGHERFVAMARAAGAEVRVLPMDLGQVFPVSGGLPLGQRAPQRQAYRLLELRRFGEALGLPLNLQPRFFPVAGDDAARLILTVDQADGTDAALTLTGALLRAVWVQERNIADAQTLIELLSENGLSSTRLSESEHDSIQLKYQACTRQAIDAGVFGAPSYAIQGEIFWGQDRLDLFERRLKA